MSANLPEISARPGSVTVCAGQLGPTTLVPSLKATHFSFSVYRGKSGVRRDASTRPMLSGATIEWLPEFGASWQVVQVPWKDAGSGGVKGLLKFSPATPEIVNAFELKGSLPRAAARRASLVLSPPQRARPPSKML